MPHTVERSQSAHIMKRLKEETKDYHARLESLPYFNALIEHKLPLDCYVNQLKALAIIHGVLENEIAATENSTLLDVWNYDLRKLPLLEKDLSFFEPRIIPDADAPVEAALNVTRINPEAGNHPVPEDEREIQAALKASDRGWVEFGYYEQRFKERGKRFSDSDTCWLATLIRLDPKIPQLNKIVP